MTTEEFEAEIKVLENQLHTMESVYESQLAILERALRYYSSGESIQIHTDVAVKAINDVDSIRYMDTKVRGC
jgi:exonuclease VII small subunit